MYSGGIPLGVVCSGGTPIGVVCSGDIPIGVGVLRWYPYRCRCAQVVYL